MAGLVINIRKMNNADNSKPYATVSFLNISQSDLETGSTELEDNKIYRNTYDLSLCYPELKDANGYFNFEKAYSTFTREMFGIQDDIKCIDIPLSKICKHNVLINRAGGCKITNIHRAYYTDEESVYGNTKTFVMKQLSKKAWIIPDDSFVKFIIDSKERFVILSYKILIYNNTYRAKVAQGPYVLNALHNFQYGICYKHNDNSYEILIPFIYDSIRICKMPHIYDDTRLFYYFAKTEDEDDDLYDIYVQLLDVFDYDNQKHCLLPCLTRNVNVVKLCKRLHFIIYSCQGKKGVIRNGEVLIKAQYSSIFGYRMTTKNDKDYMVIFVVTADGKAGLFLENKEILPLEYDSIIVEEDSGVCTLIKDKHYYIGGFKGESNVFSTKEISEDDYYKLEEDENNEFYDNQWTYEELRDAAGIAYEGYSRLELGLED